MQIKINSPLLRVSDLKDPGGLIGTLRDAPDPLSQFLQSRFSPTLCKKLAAYSRSDPPSNRLQKALVGELNQLLQGEWLYTEDRFAQVMLSAAAQEWFVQNSPRESLIRLNRFLLEDAYPQHIGRNLKPRPIWKRGFHRQQKLAAAASLVVFLLCLGVFQFFVIFWRAPLPADLVLPPGTQVIVSRSTWVMIEGDRYYLRAWCPEPPKRVANSWGKLLHVYPEKMNSKKTYSLSQEPNREFFPPVREGPPRPTNEGFDLPDPDDDPEEGNGCSYSFFVWPDRGNSQIEVKEFCGLG